MIHSPNRLADSVIRGSRTILVIDDDQDLRFLVRTALEQAGYRVLEAGDGIEGLELAASESPDLLVVDLLMPRIDGLEVLRRLRSSERGSSVPIIMLTAKSDSEIVRRSTELGARFLAKPFATPQLIASVNSCFAAEGCVGDPGHESV